ncbi:MAG: aspartate kinase, partial [Clostridia bacterium]|nr:aspartate kinase [Clostridia bacterium]
FRKVKDIVLSDSKRKIVVVSAPGKRFPTDNKVTDLLYICHAHLNYKVSFDDIWENIASRYREIATNCQLTLDVEALLASVRGGMSRKSSVDDIVSRGEYMNAKLMADYLGYDFVDATEWLIFNYDGTVNFEESYANLKELHKAHPHMVIPGFYGILPNGQLHVFSRGGSDVTGAIAAAALGVECYENFTDVSGILMADPKIVDKPKPIERITFNELRELSYMGAEVLHEETVFPVRSANIPLYIKNTNDPDAVGTLIMEDFENESDEERARFITGITGKKHYTFITVSKKRMAEDISFIRKLLELTEKYRLSVEHIPCSVDTVSLVISTKELAYCLHNLIADIERELDPDTIKVCDGVSLVAVVGRRMASNRGVSGMLFSALGNAGVNVRMIEQGSDEINIIIGVMDADFKTTIRTLYESFT